MGRGRVKREDKRMIMVDVVGSGDQRQMSEYPIPHGEDCIPAS
jgi:hypothetical protein